MGKVNESACDLFVGLLGSCGLKLALIMGALNGVNYNDHFVVAIYPPGQLIII